MYPRMSLFPIPEYLVTLILPARGLTVHIQASTRRPLPLAAIQDP
jgi:hypothetical protein